MTVLTFAVLIVTLLINTLAIRNVLISRREHRKALRDLAKATADYQHAVAAWADLERSLKRGAGRQMTLGRSTPTPPQETP